MTNVPLGAKCPQQPATALMALLCLKEKAQVPTPNSFPGLLRTWPPLTLQPSFCNSLPLQHSHVHYTLATLPGPRLPRINDTFLPPDALSGHRVLSTALFAAASFQTVGWTSLPQGGPPVPSLRPSCLDCVRDPPGSCNTSGPSSHQPTTLSIFCKALSGVEFLIPCSPTD